MPEHTRAPVSIDTLTAILDAFNRHDLDAIMSFFADDAVFLAPRGPDPLGRRFDGKAAVRQGLAARFTGIPDVHYGDDAHFVAGDRGASEWTLTGTTTDGVRIQVRGCDLWTFRDGQVVRKDSYWKIVEPEASWPSPAFILASGAGILTLALLFSAIAKGPMTCTVGSVLTCVPSEPAATVMAAGLWLAAAIGAALIAVGLVRRMVPR